MVEYWTPTKKDAPFPVRNTGYILVEEWEWGASSGRRPQS